MKKYKLKSDAKKHFVNVEDKNAVLTFKEWKKQGIHTLYALIELKA